MSKTLKSIREAVATVKDNGQKDPIDVVHLEVPLLIRLFEYAREDATKDEDLHVVTENLVKLSKSGPLSMSSYDKVIPAKEEETSAGAIALPDVALFKRQKNEGVSKGIQEKLENHDMTLDLFLNWVSKKGEGHRGWVDDSELEYLENFTVDGKEISNSEAPDIDELFQNKKKEKVKISTFIKDSNLMGSVRNSFKLDGKRFVIVTDNPPADEDGPYWN
jgi:hypothetical protein